jgi:hypothetical protein
VNFVAPLGSDPLFGPLVAHAIRVLPGHPHSWVVSLAPANSAVIFSPLAVKVFDDAVARPTAVLNGYDLGVFPGALVFAGSDITTLYSADNTGIENSLYRFTIGPAGISLKDKTPSLGGADLDSDGLSLFLSNGSVLDPVTLAGKGSLTLPAGFTPRQVRADGAASRVFLIGDGTRAVVPLAAFAGGSILAFDAKTLASLGSLEVPEDNIDRLVRWGTNGLAFMDRKERSQEFPSELEITRSHLTGTSALVPNFRVGDGPTASIVPTLTIKSGSPAVFNLTAIASNGFTGPITFSCSSLPLFAACSFNPATVTVGPGSAPLTVTITTVKTTATNRPRNGGSMILLATVLGAPLALVLASRRHRRALAALCALSLLAVLLIAGCGGGSGTSTTTITPPPPPPPPPGTTTPTGTYSIILTATSGGVSRNTVLKLVVL